MTTLLMLAIFPLMVPLSWLTKWVTPCTRRIGTEPQIRSLVRIGHEAGQIESDEHPLIHQAFILNDRSARDIMTPIEQVRAIAGGSSISQAAAEVQHSEFSRYREEGHSIGSPLPLDQVELQWHFDIMVMRKETWCEFCRRTRGGKRRVIGLPRRLPTIWWLNG